MKKLLSTGFTRGLLVSIFLIIIRSQLYSQPVIYPLTPQTKIDFIGLKKGFQNVPDENKLRNYWFWQNSAATIQSITQDLEAMKAKGYGGTLLGDNGADPSHYLGPLFAGKEWLGLFAHAVKEADRLGLELSVNIQSGFGDPGNPNIQPDNGLKKIVWSETTVRGPQKLQEKIAEPPSQIYYKDIAIQAIRIDSSVHNGLGIKFWEIKSMNQKVPWSDEDDRYRLSVYRDHYPDTTTTFIVNSEELIDLDNHFTDGVLTWDVPPGEWIVVRYGMTSTGKRNDYASYGYRGGLCYDQINSRGIEAHWNDIAEPFLEVAKKAGNSLKFVHTDSWEMGTTNWTQGLEDEFKQRRGYDITAYLPVLTNKIVGSRELSNRFLEDFRQTIGDLVAEKNYAVLRDLAHANGVLLHSESGGPHAAPIDGLQTLGINDIPMGEFWGRASTHRSSDGRRMAVKQGSSAAHIYGKRFFAAEGPTTIGPQWERSPRDLKSNIDRAFCNGVNRLFWHTYTSSPDETGLPGLEYFAGTHMNRKVTWWDQSHTFIDYLNRCTFMLSQGLYTADILSYYGSGVPNYVFLEKDVKGVPLGYAWDMCNSEVLLTRVAVKNGRIVLPDGMSYAMLSLPDLKDISLPVLRKLEQLVKEGIILVGPPPERATGLTGYPESDKELKDIVKRVWGNIDQKTIFSNSYGKGKVYSGKTIGQVLKLEGIDPDFSYVADGTVGMEYIHRSADEIEIYYVTNKWSRVGIDDFTYRYLADLPDRYIRANCSFRVDGEREIERFDPVTGEVTPVTVYKREGDRYHIPVTLGPEGSAFFVFRNSTEKRHVVSIEKDGNMLIAGNDPMVSGSSFISVKDNQVEIGDGGNYQLTWSDGKKTNIVGKQLPAVQIIDGTWRIHFMEKPSLGESFKIETDELKSWTNFSQREIKYFSGTARYSQTFTLSRNSTEKGRVYLDLGNVQEIATVRLNGSEITTCWIAPFRADITDYLKDGDNKLEIDVSNMWPNRLIGDGKLPKDERLTRTNIKTFDGPDAEKHLRVSGLLGAVKLQFTQIYESR